MGGILSRGEFSQSQRGPQSEDGQMGYLKNPLMWINFDSWCYGLYNSIIFGQFVQENHKNLINFCASVRWNETLTFCIIRHNSAQFGPNRKMWRVTAFSWWNCCRIVHELQRIAQELHSNCKIQLLFYLLLIQTISIDRHQRTPDDCVFDECRP